MTKAEIKKQKAEKSESSKGNLQNSNKTYTRWY